MTLRHYFLLSVAFFVLVVAAAYYLSFPVLPFAVMLLIGETLLGFQIEDHRVSRFLAALFKAPKAHH